MMYGPGYGNQRQMYYGNAHTPYGAPVGGYNSHR
jgi:hypothetical protein